MAGKWEQTKTPRIYVQEGRNGKPSYKAAFRALSNGRSMVTSKTFPRIGQAHTYLADKRMQTGLEHPARRVQGCPDDG